jgi:hypothetical protein
MEAFRLPVRRRAEIPSCSAASSENGYKLGHAPLAIAVDLCHHARSQKKAGAQRPFASGCCPGSTISTDLKEHGHGTGARA